MFAASYLSGVKTPTQFMPLSMPKSDGSPIQCMGLSMPKSDRSPIQCMGLSMPKSDRSPIQCMGLSMPKSDRSPIQCMGLSMPKSDRSSCTRPNFIRMQPSRMPDHSSLLRLRCEAIKYDVVQSRHSDLTSNEDELTCVIKFGSSSIDSADAIIEIANFIRTLERSIHTLDRTIRSFGSKFEEKRLVIVLSAMGKTTNKLQLAAKKMVSCDVSNVSDLEELTFIKDLHLRTVDELGIDREIISSHLVKLEGLLQIVPKMKLMDSQKRDYLLSFGECMSTSIFAAYLNKIGLKSGQDGDKSVQVKISYNPKAPEIATSEAIVLDRNATMLDIARKFCQFVGRCKVFVLMFWLRVERVLDDWLSTL